MKRLLPVTSLLLPLLLCAPEASAQQPPASTPLDAARAALNEGRYDDADRLAKQAMGGSNRGTPSPSMGGP